MSHGQTNRIALVNDLNESENCGDDQAPAENEKGRDLAMELMASNIMALSARCSRIQADQERMRQTVNRILTRFATEGRPIPTEDAA